MDAIYFEKSGQKKLVASTVDQKRVMVDHQLDIALNESGSMEFSLPITNPALSEISFLNGEVTFERSGIELFRGELYGNTENMLRTGTFKANGALSYLAGLKMDPYEYAGSVEGYFTMLMNSYNDRASEWRKIQPGRVTVEDANNYIVRSNTERVSYLQLLQEKLVDRMGGYLWLRVENGVKYLDYLAEINLPAGQDVRYGQNIVDIEQGIEYQDVYTVLIPEGKEDEETGKKLSVESVNSGSPYVINQTALAKYGRRETVISFPDVTEASNLLTKAQKALASYANQVKNIRVKAVDMAMWTDADCFRLGQSIYTKSEYHGIQDVYILSKMQIRSLQPESEVLELGDLRRTYTQIINKKVNSMDDDLQELKDKVNQQDITANSLKSITLTADTYVFKYDSSGNLTGATESNLLAKAQNVTIDHWQYQTESGTWEDYPETEDNSSIVGNSLKVKPNHPVFFGDAAHIKILSGREDIFDTLTITKLRDGGSGTNGTGGLSVILGNEAQTIACGSDGAVLEEVTAEIPFTGYVGTNQVACECTVGTLPAGVTLSRNQAATASSDGTVQLRFAAGATLGGKPNGTVSLTFALSGKQIEKKFSWSKSQNGENGSNYILESSVEVVKLGANSTLSPAEITFSAYYREGSAAERTAYAGRFKIYESTSDTSTWTLKYTSSSNQSSRTHSISSTSVKFIKCILYAAGGTTTEIATLTISVIEDAEGAVDELDKRLTQKVIFDKLTNNGEAQGLYYDESTGDLYINATYIVSGILSSIDGKNWISLDDGTFSFADGQLIYDPETGFKVSGNLIADGKITIKKVGWDDAIIEYVLDTDYELITGSSMSGGVYSKSIEIATKFYSLEIRTRGLKIDTMIANVINSKFIYSQKVDAGYGRFEELYSSELAVLQGGSYVHTARGTSGSKGYVKIARLKITANYQNVPIVFHVLQRNRFETILQIWFNSEDDADPSLKSFVHYGDQVAYLLRSAASTWDLYIPKSEAYDNICISQYHKSPYNSGIAIDWKNDHADTLPTGCTRSTVYVANDTGWTTVSSFANSITQATGASWYVPVQYRKIKNHVYIKGHVAVPSTWTGHDVWTIFTLPAEYRPATRVCVLNTLTGKNIARIIIDTDGRVILEWVVSMIDGSYVSGSLSWVQIDSDFLID